MYEPPSPDAEKIETYELGEQHDIAPSASVLSGFRRAGLTLVAFESCSRTRIFRRTAGDQTDPGGSGGSIEWGRDERRVPS